MALDTLSLPVLEPLTPRRLQDVTVLALSCLYAGESPFVPAPEGRCPPSAVEGLCVSLLGLIRAGLYSDVEQRV